eukprot:g4310.t1
MAGNAGSLSARGTPLTAAEARTEGVQNMQPIGQRSGDAAEDVGNNDLEKKTSLRISHPDAIASRRKFGFFSKGRELENRHTNHHYTPEELEHMRSFESLNYMPPNSKVYRKELEGYSRAQLDDENYDTWLMMGLIGVTVGLVGFVMKAATSAITKAKYHYVQALVDEGNIGFAWVWAAGLSSALILVATVLVVYFAPAAAGSGLPEVIGYLNGIRIRRIFSFPTVIVTFISCVCAVSSGLPIGPEGPMVHLGAAMGKGVSQGRLRGSRLTCEWPFFKRFRTSKHRRDFISAGAAAGIASAFGAPVGGLLFAMEEVASFFDLTLLTQIFFCALMATMTTDLLKSAERNVLGTFDAESGIIFLVKRNLSLHIAMFIPTILLGIVCGFLGALFTFLNLK